MEPSAPYNFVPASERVVFPGWAEDVSHDVPFRDGICGRFELTVEAETPLCVGDERDRTGVGKDEPARILPFRIGDGDDYALPGSALRGMLRNVVEIASFGKLQHVDAGRRYGFRDLHSFNYRDSLTRTIGGSQDEAGEIGLPAGEQAYEPRSRAGWLQEADGVHTITPCAFARVEHADLRAFGAANGRATWQLRDRDSACKKYRDWGPDHLDVRFDPGPRVAHHHRRSDNWLVYRKAGNLGEGATEGRLVFTGQPSPRKHLEFVFYDPPGGAEPIRVEEEAFKEFTFIHCDDRDVPLEEWEYWMPRLAGGERVPVFYLSLIHI